MKPRYKDGAKLLGPKCIESSVDCTWSNREAHFVAPCSQVSKYMAARSACGTQRFAS